jgi:hypothetical protein
MSFLTRKFIVLPLLFLGLPALSLPALAQTANTQTANTPTAQSEQQGATTGLGSSHRFKDAASAASHCPQDTVVWSTGPALTYVAPGGAGYGAGGGFYACKEEADDAGFKAK